jgi:hypothetical protein
VIPLFFVLIYEDIVKRIPEIIKHSTHKYIPTKVGKKTKACVVPRKNKQMLKHNIIKPEYAKIFDFIN